jgi:hypothetical protein
MSTMKALRRRKSNWRWSASLIVMYIEALLRYAPQKFINTRTAGPGKAERVTVLLNADGDLTLCFVQ